MTWRNWDDADDDPRNVWYDPVFTEVLPGERLIHSTSGKMGCWRRQKNGSLRFPRLMQHGLSAQVRHKGRSETYLHFENRLLS
jgi:hypothetical protein